MKLQSIVAAFALTCSTLPAYAITITPAGDSVSVTMTTGPQGDRGPTGAQGPAGAAATVAVGTVTTLPAGSNATVTNAGTNSAAVFNFGIPKGADGVGGGSSSGDMLKSTYDPTGINASPFARANHTGTQSADTITDGTANKAYTAAEKTKLSGLNSANYATSAQGAKADTAVQPPSASSTLMGWASGAWTGIRAALDSIYHGMTVTWAEITGKPTTVAASGITDAKTTTAFTLYSSHRQIDIAAKWTTPSNATTLGKITESGGLPLWNGVAWPGGGTTTKAAAYPSTDDNYGITAAYLEAALNSGFTISTSDATQKGKPAMWDASTGELKAATNGAIASVLPTCSGTDKLTSNGTAISCTADQTSGAGSGITSLNGSTVSSQTFADGANIHVSTNTGTGAHTIGITGTIPDGNIASSTSWNAKLDPATAATTYHTKAAFNSYSAAQSVKLATKMNDTSANPDGTHYGLFYNSTAFTGTPSEGMIYTDSAGKLWQYHSGAWVEKAGGGGSYTLPAATASTLGGIMVGSGLTIDGSGVLSAMAGSVNGSGLILAGLTGNQTVKKGFAYIASGNFKATFQNFSSGIATVSSFNNYSGRIVPASGGKFAWSNPVTFANNTTAAGYSVKVPPNSSVTLQSLGAGTYYATTTRNLVKTGVDEYYVAPAPPDTYTALYADFALASPCADTTSAATVAACADPTAWTTYSDTANALTLSGGKMVAAVSGSSTAAYLTASGFTAGKYDTQGKVDLNLSTVTGFTSGANFQFFDMRSSSLSGITLALRANGSTALNSVRLSYVKGDAATANVDLNYTFVAGHTYTFRVLYKLSSANADDTVQDGSYALYVSDNGGTETALAAPTAISSKISRATGITRADAGFIYISNALTETITMSKVSVGWK